MLGVTIELGAGFQEAMKEIGGMGAAISKAASEGLRDAVTVVAPGNVITNFLQGQYLKARSGNLRRQVKGWMEGELNGAVGVKSPSPVDAYSWLLTDESKTITPKRGKYLAIPIGENLTPAGLPRFASPRMVPDGFFVRSHGRLLFGYKVGKKGKFRPLFTLVTSVEIHGTGGLYDGVLDSTDNMTAAMQSRIDAALD
jgi:hypothetical protein